MSLQCKNIRDMRAVIYARVSTNTQDYQRQLYELRDYADRMGYEVVKEFSEKISGAKKVDERVALSGLLDYVSHNCVDKVLIYECSRLSRRVVDFLSVVESLTEQGVSVYIHQNGYNHYRANGGKVGRKVGYRKTDQQMKEQYAEELRLLRKGYSLANVSKLTGTAINTLRKVKRIA